MTRDQPAVNGVVVEFTHACTHRMQVSPTEFERLAGKAASKKWKASIRVDKVRRISQYISAGA